MAKKVYNPLTGKSIKVFQKKGKTDKQIQAYNRRKKMSLGMWFNESNYKHIFVQTKRDDDDGK